MTFSETNPIKVVIVDDSALIRKIIENILSSDKIFKVVGTAVNPLEAREKIKQLNPDVITLDIEMPEMDGLSFLEKIMTLRPMPVVMVSTLTQKGADASVRAMEIGAVDCIGKPGHVISEGEVMEKFKAEILLKVKTAAYAKVTHSAQIAQTKNTVQNTGPIPNSSKISFIGIGSSTGGVQALHSLLSELPPTLPPIAIVQHIQENFVSSFAKRLNESCSFPVHEVTGTMPAEPGNAYVASGRKHLEIHKEGGRFMCKLGGSELVSNHLPSATVLFQSLAKSAGKNAVGVILTGMGRDGADGLLELRKSGGYTLGQDEASCVVYGMPRAAKEVGAVEKELSLHGIAKALIERFSQ